jgi:hypothetical protein
MPKLPMLPDDLASPPVGGSVTYLLRLAERLGPWVVLAGFLVWWTTGRLDATLTRVDGKIDHVTEILVDHARASTFLQWATCMNVAGENNAAQTRCGPPPPEHRP